MTQKLIACKRIVNTATADNGAFFVWQHQHEHKHPTARNRNTIAVWLHSAVPAPAPATKLAVQRYELADPTGSLRWLHFGSVTDGRRCTAARPDDH